METSFQREGDILSPDEMRHVAGGFNPQPDPPGRASLVFMMQERFGPVFLNPQPLPP